MKSGISSFLIAIILLVLSLTSTQACSSVRLDRDMAWQTSNYEIDNRVKPGNAVDKDEICSATGNDFASSTGSEENPGWAVDMKKTYALNKVEVTVRNDKYGLQYKNFHDAYVFVSNDKPNLQAINDFTKACGYYKGPPKRPLELSTIYCPSRGRYLAIILKQRNQTLQMCEIEIIALFTDGGWTSWTQWSVCSKTSANGTRNRTRSCTNPAPSDVGEPCQGDVIEHENCIDGGWDSWNSWSACSRSCGYGTKMRTRSCTKPSPQNGGAECPGNDSETENCFQVIRPCVCVFPFEYEGEDYSKCTKVNSFTPWCSLDKKYNDSYTFCETQGDCVIPFNYGGHTFDNCTSVNWHVPWCSLDKDYVGNFKNCKTEI